MWTKDSPAEQLFAELQIKYEYKTNIPISKLKIETSKRNNPRFGESIDEDRCQTYAEHMQMGKAFPAIVIDEGYNILGGNHRVESAQLADIKMIDVYMVIGITDKQRDEFIRLDNVRHGQNLDEDQKIQAILEQNRKYGTSLQELCNKFFGSENTKIYYRVQTAKHALEVKEELRHEGLNVEHVDNSTLESLWSLRNKKNHKVYLRASIVVVRTKLSLSETDES